MILRDVLVVPRSGDSKVGPIPVTYRPARTCPRTCPLYPIPGESGGCYGTGRIFGMAGRATDVTVADAIGRIRDGMHRSARVMRDRIVGDIVGRTGRVQRGYMRAVAAVADGIGLPLFGYSHAWERLTSADVLELRRIGYTLNASVHTVDGIRDALRAGLPVTVASDHIPDGTKVDGRTVITCPAVQRPGITCNACRLCARWDRPTIVRFPIHGPARNLARAAIDELERKS